MSAPSASDEAWIAAADLRRARARIQEVCTSAYTTLTGSVSYNAATKTRLTVGAVNLTNKFPQLISYEGRPWNFNLYDGLGRQVYFRVQQTF